MKISGTMSPELRFGRFRFGCAQLFARDPNPGSDWPGSDHKGLFWTSHFFWKTCLGGSCFTCISRPRPWPHFCPLLVHCWPFKAPFWAHFGPKGSILGPYGSRNLGAPISGTPQWLFEKSWTLSVNIWPTAWQYMTHNEWSLINDGNVL